MSKQVSPIFDALEDQARKYRKKHIVFEGARICRLAAKHRNEIEALRKERHLMRQHAERKNDTNGTVITGDFHWVEFEAAKCLCPALTDPRAEVQKKAWQWFLKQDYAQEFKTAPFAKTRF